MSEIEKSVLGSVRLDSDVWDAVRAMPVSLNVYLRAVLLNGNKSPLSGRRSKKQRAAEALRASDVTAELVGRDDVEYGSHTELPTGPNVATLDAVGPKVSEGRGKASTQHFVRGLRLKGDKTR